MDINTLTEEQRAKARACTTSDELIQFAKEEGVELTDEQLKSISGGGIWSDDEPTNTPPVCPFCRHSGTLEFRPDEVWCSNCFSSWKKRY